MCSKKGDTEADLLNRNKDVASRFTSEIMSKGNTQLADSLLSDDFHSNGWPDTMQSKNALKNFTARLKHAFPDLQATPSQTIGEGDYVTVYASLLGHNDKNSINQNYFDILHIVDGKVQEQWSSLDVGPLLEQSATDEGKPSATAKKGHSKSKKRRH
jgi:predicted SnoaL-like aldol condensation-catalyzing enzyme